jgi:hypothetical protein
MMPGAGPRSPRSPRRHRRGSPLHRRRAWGCNVDAATTPSPPGSRRAGPGARWCATLGRDADTPAREAETRAACRQPSSSYRRFSAVIPRRCRRRVSEARSPRTAPPTTRHVRRRRGHTTMRTAPHDQVAACSARARLRIRCPDNRIPSADERTRCRLTTPDPGWQRAPADGPGDRGAPRPDRAEAATAGGAAPAPRLEPAGRRLRRNNQAEVWAPSPIPCNHATGAAPRLIAAVLL